MGASVETGPRLAVLKTPVLLLKELVGAVLVVLKFTLAGATLVELVVLKFIVVGATVAELVVLEFIVVGVTNAELVVFEFMVAGTCVAELANNVEAVRGAGAG